jgi:hypothetical protein
LLALPEEYRDYFLNVNSFIGTARGVVGLLHQENTFIGIVRGVEGPLLKCKLFYWHCQRSRGTTVLHQVNTFIDIARGVEGLLLKCKLFYWHCQRSSGTTSSGKHFY